MSTTSVSLICRLSSSSADEAWQRFVQLYSPLLFHWARKIGLGPEEAADIVQDVMLVLLNKLPEFEYDPSRSFRGWMRTITLNHCRTYLRQRSRGPQEVLGQEMQQIAAGDDVELFSDEEYRTHLTRRALEIMQTEFETATWRACWEQVVQGRKAAEVADELGLSRNAAYLAKSRVLQRLRQELDGLWD